VAEQLAAEERAAEQRAAEERALAEQRAASQRAAEEEAARRAASQWQPAPEDGQWLPAGTPGSNWSPTSTENGSADEYVGRRRAPEPTMSAPSAESRGRHSGSAEAADLGRPSAPSPTLATPSPPPPPPHPPASQEPAPRHRSADDAEGGDTGGHSVADLLARLEVGSTEGGRRRRREE
jgi:hypothetical protein